MYATSPEYKASLDTGWLDTDVRGKITLKNGATIGFTEKDIVPGSLAYTNKALNGNDFCFGGIYVGELDVDLMKDIDRYSLLDAKVEVTYIHRTAEGVTDEIPIGIFYVFEATRTKRIVSIKAYDSMTDFDKEVEETITGTMYDILSFISEKCEVPLAQSEEQINAFVNSEWWLTLDMELIATYREALSSIGLLTGRFATINRSGELEFRTFSTELQGTISARRRTASTIADYKTYFNAVKARFMAKENFYPYEARDELRATGLTLNLGDIAIFQGEDTSKRLIMDNLLQVALSFMYVPVEVSMISDPSIDLGDCIELENVNNSYESVSTCIHSISWAYHSTQTLESYGSNPRLKGIVTREDKLLSQMEAQLASKDIVVKTYTNSRRLSISNQKEQEVILFNFATIDKTTVMFMGTIPFESEADGVVVFRTYLDGVTDDSATTRVYFERGGHVVSLTNYFPMAANGRATLKITAQTEYFESDYRKRNAEIISLLNYARNHGGAFSETAVDSSVPTISVKKSSIKGLLFAQGIAGAGQWDGTINLADELKPVPVDRINVFNAIRVGRLRDIGTARNITVRNKRLNEPAHSFIIDSGEIVIRAFDEDTGINRKEIPHGDGRDAFRAVRVGGRKITIGSMSATPGVGPE